MAGYLHTLLALLIERGGGASSQPLGRYVGGYTLAEKKPRIHKTAPSE